MVVKRSGRNRSNFRWGYAYTTSTGDHMVIGEDQASAYRRIIDRRRAAGLPYGSIWRRRVTYGPWRVDT